jgi:hypothetical protein
MLAWNWACSQAACSDCGAKVMVLFGKTKFYRQKSLGGCGFEAIAGAGMGEVGAKIRF